MNKGELGVHVMQGNYGIAASFLLSFRICKLSNQSQRKQNREGVMPFHYGLYDTQSREHLVIEPDDLSLSLFFKEECNCT